MKTKRLVGFFMVLLLVAVMTACGEAVIENKDICKKWGYDSTSTDLKFTEKGKATFEGVDYSFTIDDTYITLTYKKDQVEKHRYELTKDGLYFYHNMNFKLETDLGEGIRGVWSCGENSFEFTAYDTFLEDGFFTGHYSVNEAEGTIKLMYEHDMIDTVLYYTLDGDKLLIEYPYFYVETKK